MQQTYSLIWHSTLEDSYNDNVITVLETCYVKAENMIRLMDASLCLFQPTFCTYFFVSPIHDPCHAG